MLDKKWWKNFVKKKEKRTILHPCALPPAGPPYQGCVQGFPLFVVSECGDFGISKFYSVMSLHSLLPPAVWNSETLSCVINSTSAKRLPSRAPGSCRYFRLLRAQACPPRDVMTRESVPRPPYPLGQAQCLQTALGIRLRLLFVLWLL